MFVGNFKKGPIRTTFDGVTGKGLPEFCEVEKEIDRSTNTLVVGVDLKVSDETKTLLNIES